MEKPKEVTRVWHGWRTGVKEKSYIFEDGTIVHLKLAKLNIRRPWEEPKEEPEDELDF